MNAEQFWSNMGPPAPNEAELDAAGADWREYPCREWLLGCAGRGGYGRVRFDGLEWQANRLAFVLVNGTIPEDKPLVCHRCDNPPCCEPRHLLAGTHKDNSKDCFDKGRSPVSVALRASNEVWRGRSHTPEARAKISAGLLGKVHTQASREKQSATRRARYDVACRRGHERTAENTRTEWEGWRPRRRCLDCRRSQPSRSGGLLLG